MKILSTFKKVTSGVSRRGQKENGYLRNNFAQSHSARSRRLPGPPKRNIEKLLRKLFPVTDQRRPTYRNRASRHRTSSTRKVLILGGIALTGIVLLLLARPAIEGKLQDIAFFSVDDIELKGNSFVSKDVIREVTGIVPHQTSLFGFDEKLAEKRLAELDWIASVSVRKNWPSTIEITVSENQPVALLHSANSVDGQLRYIDGKGRPFMTVTPGADVDYPVITGVSDILDSSVKKEALASVLELLGKVNLLNNAFLPAQLISEIHVDDRGELVVYLVEYPFPIFFGNGNTSKKVKDLGYVMKELYGKRSKNDLISQVKYIQMDYQEGKVLVKKSGSG